MPTYQYRCKDCKAFMELHQSFYDDSIPDCVKCEKPMSKVIQATPAIFRGGGWGGSK